MQNQNIRILCSTLSAIILVGLLFSIYSVKVFAAVDKKNAINSIVAIVNDNIITLMELDNEIQVIKTQLRQQRLECTDEGALVPGANHLAQAHAPIPGCHGPESRKCKQTQQVT